MQSPTDFKLEPLDVKNCPAPFPPRLTKSHFLNLNSNIFKQADDHAISEVKINYRCFKDMIWNLVYKNQWSEIEKARIIFTWMREKNLNTINFDNALQNSVEHLFELFSDSKTTYSSLFECIARHAGFHCVIISGWVKGAEYHPGQELTTCQVNHSWNALYIDGNWQLMDTMWASRYVQIGSEAKIAESPLKKRISQAVGELIYEPDDFYFMSDPSLLIYSHLPDETAWQLLHPVVSKQMYDSYPKIKSFFFTSGMIILSQNRGVIATQDGILTLTLGYTKPTLFKFFIVRESDYEENIPLKRYVIQEITKNRLTYYFRSPKEGSYYLTIYAQPTGTYLQTSGQYKAICEYKILCDQPARDIRPFPNCEDSSWGGYTASLRDLTIHPDLTNAILIAEPQSIIKINFSFKDIVPIYAFLKRNGMDQKIMNRYIRVVPYKDGAMIEVRPPEAGEYGLEVYAGIGSGKATGSEQVESEIIHLCQYLLLFKRIPFYLAYGIIYDRDDIKSTVISPNKLISNNMKPKLLVESNSNLITDKNNNYQRPKFSSRESILDIYDTKDKFVSNNGHKFPLETNILRKKKPQKEFKHSSSVKIPGNKNLALKPRASLNSENFEKYHSVPGNLHSIDTYPTFENSLNEPNAKVILIPNYKRNDDKVSNNKNPTMNISYASYKKKPSSFEDIKKENLTPVRKNYEVPSSDIRSDQYNIHASTGLKPFQQKQAVVAEWKTRDKSGATLKPSDKRYLDYFYNDSKSTTSVKYLGHSLQKYAGPLSKEVPIPFKILPLTGLSNFITSVEGAQSKPFENSSVFASLDMHVIQVLKEEYKSFKELMWSLIFARNVENQMEKARILFFWLSSKDISHLNFVNACEGSPEEILMALKHGLTSYAFVYEILCSYAGLKCTTVNGYAKGSNYEPGMKFEKKDLLQNNEKVVGSKGEHAWNCVLIDGICRFVDCQWAARKITQNNEKQKLDYSLDEFYFMPLPHQFIFSHFPFEQAFQLLPEPISLSVFENLVPLKSAFFKLGLHVVEPKQSHILSSKESIFIIKIPHDKIDKYSFTYELTFLNGSETYNGVLLNRFAMLEIIKDTCAITMRPPINSTYLLTVFARDSILYHKYESINDKQIYECVLEYLIEFDAKENNEFVAFPPCVLNSWGPTDTAQRLGIVALQKGAKFIASCGVLELSFHLSNPRLKFIAKLRSNEQPSDNLKRHVLTRRVGPDLHLFTIYPPTPDEYGLEIYANGEDNSGMLILVYQYLVVGSIEVADALPPMVNILGFAPHMQIIQIKPLSHIDPYIRNEEGELKIEFEYENGLRIASKLLFYSSDQSTVDMSNFTITQWQKNKFSFGIRLLEKGFYNLQLFGEIVDETKSEDEEMNLFASYLILNLSNSSSLIQPYPRQFAAWSEGCCLYQPLDANLNTDNYQKVNNLSKKDLMFNLEVKGANEVIVLGGDQQNILRYDIDGHWTGILSNDFLRELRDGKITICARYKNNEDGDDALYALLQYNIQA